MPWGPIRGHDRIVEDLRHALEGGRLPHAMLFVGPEGVGKHTFARRVAQALLCEARPDDVLEPCGVCPSCRRVESGDHPDLHEVAKPEDRHELPIAVIRGLIRDLGLKPMRGSRKIAIVDDADDLNEEASNAFLKTLEEPPERALLILIGTSVELQLDTIVSRCRVVRFEPLAESELTAVLLERGLALDDVEAARVAHLAEGSVARARGLADAELGAFRRGMIDELAALEGFDPSELARRLEEFIKQAGKESLPQRTRAALLFGELARFFRGVLWQNAGLESPAPDLDDRRAAEALGRRLEPEAVFLLAERCLMAEYHLRRRVYLPLLLESFTRDLGAWLAPAR